MNTLYERAVCFTGIAGLAGLIAAGGAFAGQTAGQYIDDSTITARVKTGFMGDPQVKAHEINVKTYNGVVELNGFVDSSNMIAEATQDAEKVPGVREVDNNLAMKNRQ
jgi:hyperosmotically inducible periplasmic protein